MNEIIGIGGNLLRDPMPAESALKVIRSMYESNRMIEWDMDYYDQFLGARIKITSLETPIYSSTGAYGLTTPVTINSITQIIPTYSIGDRVSILSTGVIENIIGLYEKDGEVMYQFLKSKSTGWRNICKLPNNL